MTTEHSDEESWDSLVHEQEKLHLADLTSRRASRSDSGKLNLGEPRGQLNATNTRGDESLQTIDATPSGEVQFRLPSRQAGGNSDALEEPRVAGAMTRSRRRAMEPSQAFMVAEQEQRPLAYTTEPERRRPVEVARAGVSRPEAIFPATSCPWIPGSNFDLPRGVNSNQTAFSIMGRGRGLPMLDHEMMGERINGGEQEGSWRHEVQRGSSPTCRPRTSPGNGEPMPRHIVRGSRGNPGFDGARPSHTEDDRVSQYETRGFRPTQQDVGRSEHRGSRKYRKPATYDGTGNWSDYLVHFEIVAEINKWEEGEKALELATCLRGAAQGVLGDLRPENRRNFSHLVAALNTRFQPDNQAELYRAQMKNRLRKRSEPLSELGHDIKRLVRLAYPAAPLEVREHLARDCFIDSLNNSEMEWAVFQGKPASVDEAMRLAVEFEAFQTGRKRRLDGKADVRMQQEIAEPHEAEDNWNSVVDRLAKLELELPHRTLNQSTYSRPASKKVCYYCGDEGHFIAKCPRRQEELRPTTGSVGNRMYDQNRPRQTQRSGNNFSEN
jgi:hypothetical protein